MISVSDTKLFLLYYFSENRKKFGNMNEWVEHYGGRLIEGHVADDEFEFREDTFEFREDDYIIFKLKFGL